MSTPLDELMERHTDRVRAILNILVESPYFYRADDEDLFFFLRRHRNEFSSFYETFYGWRLLMDSKCARVYKEHWYNESITEANRDIFDFRSRDECIGFMLLLEYFEHLLEESTMTVEDAESPKFLFGDLLRYAHRRLTSLFPEQEQRYTEDYVRSRVLRRVLPMLEKYRLLRRLRPPTDEEVQENDTIFEALPALYHYNVRMLGQAVERVEGGRERRADDGTADVVDEPVDGPDEPAAQEQVG